MLRTIVTWNNPNVLDIPFISRNIGQINTSEILYRNCKSCKIYTVPTFLFWRTRIPYPEPMLHHTSVGPTGEYVSSQDKHRYILTTF